MIKVKEGVRFSIFTDELLYILDVINSIKEKIPTAPCAVITCGSDGHGPNDPHTFGFAVDIRSKHYSSYDIQNVLGWLIRYLGPRYTVIHESIGEDNEHIHIQLRKDLWPSRVIK